MRRATQTTQIKVRPEAPRPKRPAGQEIQRPKFAKFEEVGDSIEGVLLGLTEVPKYKSEETEQRYVLLDDDGAENILPNGADLVREKPPLGKLVLFVKKHGFGARIYIEYIGERDTGQGKALKEYYVAHCEGATVTKLPTKVSDTVSAGQMTSVSPQPEAAGGGPDSGDDSFEASVSEE